MSAHIAFNAIWALVIEQQTTLDGTIWNALFLQATQAPRAHQERIDRAPIGYDGAAVQPVDHAGSAQITPAMP